MGMLFLGEQDFSAGSHNRGYANSLVMVTLRQATRKMPAYSESTKRCRMRYLQ
jgi:hypothetical protein